MQLEVIPEQPAFVLRAGGGYDAEPANDETVEVSWAELRAARVGETWQARYRGNVMRDTRNEEAVVVYKTDDGAAILFRSWGVSDHSNPVEWSSEPRLVWYEFLP